MKIAIVLPLTKVGFYEPDEVIDFHLRKQVESKEFYFSTSNRMDYKKASQVDYVILANKNFAYISNKKDYIHFDEKSAPEDVKDYVPEEFSNDLDLHWFKLSNLRKIGLDELNNFEMVNKKVQLEYGGVGNYIRDTKRLQVFYGKK